MKLAEHPDFAAFLTAAATESELPETFVEKDYWITEILHTIATTVGERAIFKGGTSLSKGWDLLDRFSEDIDLFIDPAAEPPLRNERAINRAMKPARLLRFGGGPRRPRPRRRSRGSRRARSDVR